MKYQITITIQMNNPSEMLYAKFDSSLSATLSAIHYSMPSLSAAITKSGHKRTMKGAKEEFFKCISL